MTPEAAFVLIVIGIAMVLFVTEALRSDLVALLVLVTLGVSGILTPQEAFSGFSRSAVITIIGIFILTAGLEKTGVTHTLGVHLVRLGGFTEGRMMVVLMLAAAFLSLFMNNIAAGSVLLPVAVGVARERNISPSKLMMPLAFGILLGGMATLLTTSNILASAVLRDNGLEPFNLLSFAPAGIPAVFVGIVYMYFFGRKLLPRRAPADWERMLQAGRATLADIYGLRERWFHARVPAHSPLVGKSLSDVGLGRELGVNVVAIVYDGKSRLAPPPSTRLQLGDILYLEAREEQIDSLRTRGLEVQTAPPTPDLNEENIRLFEVVLSPRSTLFGKTLRQIHFREKFDLNVLAIWRDSKPRRVDIGDMQLQHGDALLVLGPAQRAKLLAVEPDFIVLTASAEEGLRNSKAWLAAGIMAITLLISAVGVVQIAEAMLLGALAMVLVGALTMDEAYQSIEWRVIFFIAGMLPAGLALVKTGAAAWIANLLISMLGSFTPVVVMAGLMVLTMLLTQVMSGPATIVILAPIALTTAQQLHSNPTTFVLATALAASMAFLTPLGHPINVLVMGPGGYKFNDYFRVGAVLTVLLLVFFVALLPLVYGI